MKKKIIYILAILILIIILTVTLNNLKTEEVMGLNESVIKVNFRKSEEEIRDSILEVTPIGTSMEDVLKIIDNNKEWRIEWIRREVSWDHTNLSSDYIIGAKSIKVLASTYLNIFESYVEIYWGFDENDELIEIGIRKTSNML